MRHVHFFGTCSHGGVLGMDRLGAPMVHTSAGVAPLPDCPPPDNPNAVVLVRHQHGCALERSGSGTNLGPRKANHLSFANTTIRPTKQRQLLLLLCLSAMSLLLGPIYPTRLRRWSPVSFAIDPNVVGTIHSGFVQPPGLGIGSSIVQQ